MDLYSNNRMLNWEARRRVAEMQSMAATRESAERGEQAEDGSHEPFTSLHRTWHTFFHRANHGYKQA